MSTESLAQTAHEPPREDRWRAIRERSTRGLLFYNSGPDFAHLEGDLWAVRASEGGGFWRIDLGEETCDCPDFTHFGSCNDVNCKHIVAVAIASATRRSHVREVRTLSVAAGDPFKAASWRPCACINGWVCLGVEEDGAERTEAVPCRRCRGAGRYRRS